MIQQNITLKVTSLIKTTKVEKRVNRSYNKPFTNIKNKPAIISMSLAKLSFASHTVWYFPFHALMVTMVLFCFELFPLWNINFLSSPPCTTYTL